MPADGIPLIDPEEFKELGKTEAQTVATFIGMFYCLFIYLDNCNMSIWKLDTLKKNPLASSLGVGMVCLSVVVMLLFPDLFQVTNPDKKGWVLALFLPLSAHYLMRLVYASHLVRNLERDLIQP
jgi:cation-transporting ATPase E